MLLFIIFYIISFIGSWLLFRNFEMKLNYTNVSGFEVFLVLCPLMNTLIVIVLVFNLLFEWLDINWNKFFLIKK